MLRLVTLGLVSLTAFAAFAPAEAQNRRRAVVIEEAPLQLRVRPRSFLEPGNVVALNNLAVTARSGKTKPAEMQGGTLTITNIGALGIDTGTPIINPGEVAIVAFGTIKQKPWVLDGEVIPRWITTLGGSFDHRVVDGDLSARFMADVAAILEEPALLLD